MKLAVVTLLILLSGCQSTAPTNGGNYETQGNLQPQNSLGCVELSAVSSAHSPADLFLGLDACLEQDQFEQAADLYLVAVSYGFFDTRRVADRSAHQAIMVLRMNTFANHQEQALNELLAQIIHKTTDNSVICAQIKNIGMPSYFPTYMIQHGIGTFTEQKHSNGLIDNFNPDKAWKQALTSVVKCA